MLANKFTKRLRFFALLSFIIPIITINACWYLFSFIGTVSTFDDQNWSNTKIEFKPEAFEKNFSDRRWGLYRI